MTNNKNAIIIDISQINSTTSKLKKLAVAVKAVELASAQLTPKMVAADAVNDKFSKSIEKTEKAAKKFTQLPLVATLTVEDNATGVIDSVARQARKFAKEIYKATLSVDGSSALSTIQLIKSELGSLNVRNWNIKLNFSSLSAGVDEKPGGGTLGQNTSPKQRYLSQAGIYPVSDNASALEKIFYGGAAAGGLISNYDTLHKTLKALREEIVKKGLKTTAISKLSTIGKGLTAWGIFEGANNIRKGFMSNNAYDKADNVAKGITVIGSTLAGAKLGGMFGGPLGAALGGAAGYVLGKVGGDSIANLFTGGMIGAQKNATVSPDAAKRLEELRAKQAELAKSTLDSKFGKIKLSAQQMAAVAEGLFSRAQTARIYSAEVAISNLNDSMMTLQESSSRFDSELGSATASGNLSPDQLQSLGSSATSFTGNATNTLNQQKYAAGKSVEAIMGDTKEGKALKESIEKGFSKKDDKLQQLVGKFEETMRNAQADGKISGQEQNQINQLSGKINMLVANQSNNSSLEANLSKYNFGKGQTDWSSFTGVIDQAAASANQRASALDQNYQVAAQYLSPTDRSKLLLGNNGNGDEQGLYHEQTELYTGIMDKVAKQFEKQMGGELAYFLQSTDAFQSDKTYQEYMEKSKALDDGEKAVLGEFVDSLAPLAKSLIESAQQYESIGKEVPDQIKNQLKWLEHLKKVSAGEGLDWMAEDNRNEKFKAENYKYLAYKPPSPTGGQPDVQQGQGIMGTNPNLLMNAQLMLNGKPVISEGEMLTQEDFGIPRVMQAQTDIYIKENKIKGEAPNPEVLKSKPPMDITDPNAWFKFHTRAEYRGGIVGSGTHKGFANGGYVQGGAQLVTVAEEGTPEAIIPLGSHRRKRALELFSQVGRHLAVPGFAMGGIVGGTIGGTGIGGGSPIVQVGGVEIKVEGKDGQNLVETIREHKEQISEEIAGVFNAAFKGQFANTPAVGGAS